jgi:pimeloyl-ACP methyl ester carboxylesterase
MPDAQFVLFEDCGHFPMLERPERYMPILCEAIDG